MEFPLGNSLGLSSQELNIHRNKFQNSINKSGVTEYVMDIAVNVLKLSTLALLRQILKPGTHQSIIKGTNPENDQGPQSDICAHWYLKLVVKLYTPKLFLNLHLGTIPRSPARTM